MRLIFDIDFILFAAASVAEETFITAKHEPTGQVVELENRTQLWGHHAKKVGGWVGTQNAISGNDYYKAEDFTVTDHQRPRPFRVRGETYEDEHGNVLRTPDTFLDPFEGAKKSVVDQINAICGKLKCNDYYGYTGRGEVFRHKLATLLPYKGQRADTKPLILEELKDWACKELPIEMVTDIEADDACSIATVQAYNRWKAMDKDDKYKEVQIAIDKDAKQTVGFHFNPMKDKTIREISGFGSLWLTEKGDVDGMGRMWLYYQVAVGDSTDNYKSNCFSEVKYASKGGYNDLKDCTNDKEALTALVGIFKKLYPETKDVETFRGKIRIDWLYVMQEMWHMAMMQRGPGDTVDVKAVLTKLGVEH